MTKYASFLFQVHEYHPAWDKWLKVGNIQIERGMTGVASIGPQYLPCLSGEYENTTDPDPTTVELKSYKQNWLLPLHSQGTRKRRVFYGQAIK